MKIGIIGLPGSGKTTIFNCLTGSTARLSTGAGVGGQDANVAVVAVPDKRLDRLSEMYEPKKTTHAQIQYVDVAGVIKAREGDEGKGMDELLRHLRPVDALLHVVRCFDWAGTPPSPQEDYDSLEEEMIFSDLIIVERRLERMEADLKKGRKVDQEEFSMLKEARELLEKGVPLRKEPRIASSQKLRGYAFLTAKPEIVCLNTGDDHEEDVEFSPQQGTPVVQIQGRTEMEIMELGEEEQDAFRKEMGIDEPAMFRLIRESYRLLGLISFFTVGKDEVKAWTIRQGTTAQKAAGVIHSDIERGFIRAEVVAFDDLVALGSHAACQKAGKVRLEGKDYVVKDGDVINFRFNV